MIDTHAHLPLCQGEISEIIGRAKQAGLDRIVQVSIDIPSALEGVELAQQYPMVVPTIGIHPLSLPQENEIDAMRDCLNQHAGIFCAIGEIGLDYKYQSVTRDYQINRFKEQLIIAREYRLPVIIHAREAEADVIQIIQEFPDLSFVLHCFTGLIDFDSVSDGNRVMVSVTGLVTYTKQDRLVSAVSNIPLENMMIETDCPYLTPVPYRSKRNEPSYLIEIARKIADIKSEPLMHVIEVTTQNAKRFFSLSKHG